MTKKTKELLIDRPVYGSQAERVFSRFGSATNLKNALAAMGVNLTHGALSQWKRGDGLIPNHRIMQVIEAAYHCGVILTSEDLDPRITCDPKENFESSMPGERFEVKEIDLGKIRKSSTMMPNTLHIDEAERTELDSEIKDLT